MQEMNTGKNSSEQFWSVWTGPWQQFTTWRNTTEWSTLILNDLFIIYETLSNLDIIFTLNTEDHIIQMYVITQETE